MSWFRSKETYSVTSAQFREAMDRARWENDADRRAAEAELVESAYDYREAQALLGPVSTEGDARIDAVVRRRLAIERAKKAVNALGFSCYGLDSLRRWRRASGHSGVGVLFPKSMLEAAFEAPLPEDI